MVAAAIAALTDEPVLSNAFDWLCKRRRDYPAHADVWDFRRYWPKHKPTFVNQILEGRYRIDLLTRLRPKDRDEIDLWSARVALVMKALSLVLPRLFGLSKSCAHLKGHGGAKLAVRQTFKCLPHYHFVLKTDV